MFEKEQFVADIRGAMTEGDAQSAVSEVIARAITEPAGIIKELGAPGKGRSEQLFHDEGLTITNVIWGSEMWVPPHDHTMWAVIGVYQGQEDNTFWREDGNRLAVLRVLAQFTKRFARRSAAATAWARRRSPLGGAAAVVHSMPDSSARK